MRNINSTGRRTSEDLRSKIVHLYMQFDDYDTVAKRLNMDRRTVIKYVALYFHNTSLPTLGRPSFLTEITDPQILKFIVLMIQHDPTLFLWELCNLLYYFLELKVSISYMCRIRKKILGFRRKKLNLIAARRSSERVQSLRRSFALSLRTYFIDQLIFIDETHISRKDCNRKYGCFKSRQKNRSSHSETYVAKSSWSLILAMSTSSLMSPFIKKTVDEGCNETDFEDFLERLLPYIQPYHVIVFDNVRIHRTRNILQWLDTHKVRYCFMAPYSPDLSPIELVFNILKCYLKVLPNASMEMEKVILNALNRITSTQLRGCFRHCFERWNRLPK